MDQKSFNELIKKIDAARKEGGVDLSRDEDLSIAVMNLISLEEHFFFSGEKTGRGEYFDMLSEVREARKRLLSKLVPRHEGETWCISKHLLASSIRLVEVGTKLYSDGNKEEAKEIFDYAYKIYSVFWGLRLRLLSLPEIKTMGQEEKPWTLKDIVSKLVNCCDE